MRIAVSTVSDPSFRGVREITSPVLADYCAAHGYDYRPTIIETPVRSVHWDRYLVLRKLLEEGYDRVAHFDCDVLVTNPAIRLQDFPVGGDLVISENLCEDGRMRFNDGVAIFDAGSEGLVGRIFSYEVGDEPIYCGQDVIQKLYDSGEIRPTIVPQDQLNSFRYSEYGMSGVPCGDWKPGDFVLHLPGRTNERRIEIFSNLL